MRKIPGAAVLLTLLATGQAFGEDRYILNQNQTGLNLPGVTIPQGYDEVRTSDGTSCRTSNAGSGAYVDVGVVGTQDQQGGVNNGAVYGRVVVPLGRTGARLNCRRLYELEIQRLEMEVRLLRAGLNRNGVTQPTAEELDQGWTTNGKADARELSEGWTTRGRIQQ